MPGKVIICDACGVEHDFESSPIGTDEGFREKARKLGWRYLDRKDFCPKCAALAPFNLNEVMP